MFEHTLATYNTKNKREIIKYTIRMHAVAVDGLVEKEYTRHTHTQTHTMVSIQLGRFFFFLSASKCKFTYELKERKKRQIAICNYAICTAKQSNL